MGGPESNTVIITLISTAGGIAIAYITNVLAKKVQENRQKTGEPKDRMERMFDGYERLIKQKDVEDERKQKTINTLERTVGELESQVMTTKDLLSTTREELRTSKIENQDLRTALTELRAEYASYKREHKSV